MRVINGMQTKWKVLVVVIFMYLPVSIDATILYVAAPLLSVQLQATYSQLLWIMDIYPLIMAALLLSMGAVGDRIGYKKLAIYGTSLFGFASLSATFATSASLLIAARALLAVGASMILPATLAAVRRNFPEEKDRNLALGIWTAIGTCGALAGPLAGGALLTHFYWGSVFLINVPIALIVLMMLKRMVPDETSCSPRPVNLSQALLLMSAILMLIYSAKNLMRPGDVGVLPLYFLLISLVLLAGFIAVQVFSATSLLDRRLIAERNIIAGVILAMTSMITLVGFELVISQELQFVHRFTPLEAGMYMLPLMLAASAAGPLAAPLITRFGIRPVAITGLAGSAMSLYALSGIDFVSQPYKAWAWMVLLGVGDTLALMASSSAIMTAAPANKAASAGSIEGMSYELGTGLGITLFGSMLAAMYSTNVHLPEGLPDAVSSSAASSFSEAVEASRLLDNSSREQLLSAASSAFMHSHSITLEAASIMLGLLMLLTFVIFKPESALRHD